MALLRDVRDEIGSSYLLDHVDNPVAWRTWSEDTFEEAARRDLPIFLSIGYAACHWCHVMAHESFEDTSIAALLNEHFVPVKVDREERPDVDAVYMAATQLVAGNGGWPMSVFVLPDGRPFMAGTYYPPVDRGGHVGFTRLLEALAAAWRDQRPAIERQAEELAASLAHEVRFIDHLAPHHEALDLTAVRRELSDELLKQFDVDGGFGRAPKFPRPSFIEALLDVDDDAARRAVTVTLEAMSRRGLYDHFGGGFARYSVDASWHVPHFEKMLSDQALLARCYLEASVAAARSDWRDVALDTLAFVARELRYGLGYASSLDADAGGVEGAHVTWTPDEVVAALGVDDQARLDEVLQRWRLTGPLRFEGRYIPQLAEDEPFITPPSLQRAWRALVDERARRVQPSRDEKVILEWNAMIASAFLRSLEPTFESLGIELLRALASTHFDGVTWWRTEQRRAHATAADLAWYVDACLDAFEATGSDEWLTDAHRAARFLLGHYWDGTLPSADDPHVGGGVFSQSDQVKDLRTRPKEIFDGATPSAHAVTTRALARLSLCRGENELLVVAQRLVELAAPLLLKSPAAVPDLVAAAGYALEGVEVVVPGDRGALFRHVRSKAMRRTVVVSGSGASPLLEGRDVGLAYVCRSGVCERPTSELDVLDAQLAAVELSWPS